MQTKRQLHSLERYLRHRLSFELSQKGVILHPNDPVVAAFIIKLHDHFPQMNHQMGIITKILRDTKLYVKTQGNYTEGDESPTVRLRVYKLTLEANPCTFVLYAAYNPIDNDLYINAEVALKEPSRVD